MNLEKSSQCSVNIEISLDLKVYFSLVTCKINNLIALRSTNQFLHRDDYASNIKWNWAIQFSFWWLYWAQAKSGNGSFQNVREYGQT